MCEPFVRDRKGGVHPEGGGIFPVTEVFKDQCPDFWWEFGRRSGGAALAVRVMF